MNTTPHPEPELLGDHSDPFYVGNRNPDNAYYQGIKVIDQYNDIILAEFQVRQHHLDQGHAQSCNFCPIAHAIQDQMLPEFLIGVGGFDCSVYKIEQTGRYEDLENLIRQHTLHSFIPTTYCGSLDTFVEPDTLGSVVLPVAYLHMPRACTGFIGKYDSFEYRPDAKPFKFWLRVFAEFFKPEFVAKNRELI